MTKGILLLFYARVEAHKAVTEAWLKEKGFKYHGIISENRRGGNYHWIDDRTVRATKFMVNSVILLR